MKTQSPEGTERSRRRMAASGRWRANPFTMVAPPINRSIAAALLSAAAILALPTVARAQSGGGYAIRNGTIDSGGGTVTGGAYRLSGTAGQHDAGDPSGGGYLLTGGFWSPAAATVTAPLVLWDSGPLAPTRTGRTVSISLSPPTATGGAGTAAVQIEMVDLQHPIPHNRPANPTPNFTTFDTRLNGLCSGATAGLNYDGHHCDTDADCLGPNDLISTDDGTCGGQVACGVTDGCVRWVGPVTTFREKQGVPALGTYKAGRLQCTPYYTDWTELGPFSVFGAEIIPSSTYRVRSFAAECKFNESSCTNVSPTVTLTTRRSGDVAFPWNPPDTGDQPTGGDVGEVLNKFKGSPGSPSNIAALIFGNVPDPNSDVGGQEIGETVNAFKGLAYAFSGPCACPSTVTCGATACTSTDSAPCGAGLCVITCVGGVNDGLPCRDFPPNTPADHCPGGSCPTNGFCRDRCGRCN